MSRIILHESHNFLKYLTFEPNEGHSGAPVNKATSWVSQKPWLLGVPVVGLYMHAAGKDDEARIRVDHYLRRTIIFGIGDSQKLEDLVKSSSERGWPHVNRSTIIRSLVRVAAKSFNSSGFPHDTLGVQLYSLMPEELRRIEMDGGEKPEKNAEKPLSYQRKTVVFSREDSQTLDDLVRIGQIHRWREVNRSTIVRALIAIAHHYESQFGYPETEKGKNLLKTFEDELRLIDSTGLRPGVNPVNHRFVNRRDVGD